MGDDLVLAHLGFAGIIVYLMELAKKAKWVPFISMTSGHLNRIVSILTALGVAIGATMHNTGSFDTGYHFTLDTPTGPLMLQGVLRFAGQVVMQQGIFKTMVSRTTDPEKVSIPVIAPKPEDPATVFSNTPVAK